jgi:CPA2 family monovalent cation:H+ antiporter-2
MNQADFLTQATVYLAAALITVPIASRLGLGSVLGYLGAGLAIGPWGLGLIGDEGEEVQHFAEFGVVMMLFLVGLELQPSRLWRMRGPIFGLGGLQVLGSAALIAAGATLVGLSWREGVALGLILAMSSTAIALQSLNERGLSRAESGQSAFSVLLFQDLAVIPILALLPALGTHTPLGGEEHHGASFADGLAPWAYALLVLGAVAAVVVGGRFLGRPFFRLVARTGLREMFTAASLLLVVGVAQLMTLVGLSAALGTFLAGVVLAESEYRHELESDIEPFKGLLLGVFFIAVGSAIDVGVVMQSPLVILGLLLGVLTLKGALLVALGRAWGIAKDQTAIFAASLAGVGEFAFVLFGFATREGVLTPEQTKPLLAVTALSMAATPLLLLFVERLVLPRLIAVAPPARESDVEDHGQPVIIAGYGRFGQIPGRFLTANGVGTTTVDVDGDQIDMLRRFGQRVYYGDASRLDLLTAAGAARARLLIVAVDDHEKCMQIVHLAQSHFPNLAILARARGRAEAYDLMEAKVEGVYRETFDTALRVGVDALRLLGHSSHRAHRAAQMFRRVDERTIVEMAAVRHDQERLMRTARDRVALLERTLAADRARERALDEGGWDAETMRDRQAPVESSDER